MEGGCGPGVERWRKLSDEDPKDGAAGIEERNTGGDAETKTVPNRSSRSGRLRPRQHSHSRHAFKPHHTLPTLSPDRQVHNGDRAG